jgi:DNA-binding NarL/FixJ family response regulator
MQIGEEVLIVSLRTLLVEDHKGFRDYIRSALRTHPGIELVGEAENGLEAVERAAALQADLIILDIGLPGLNGIEAARRIRINAGDTKIVFLSQESSPDIVHEAFKVGARGYILKSCAARDLTIALRVVMSGGNFVSAELNGRK